ncbi:skin secretory protein xP2-like [Zalophus californianus]|uniref:Skin secretory protein xP2-like n=1 Tax=Zalophus californianus TaxID=9704 RepID=A0A6J2FJM1_ZALCA|nr:skin secretory protein xP2-like [Zalophus californianus]
MDAVPRWGFHVRAPHRLWPFGRKDRKKATEDMEKQLADVPSSLTEGLTPQASRKTGAGDCRARPPTPRGPPSQVVVHQTVVQEPEPTEVEAEAEAAPPPEELEPDLEGGLVPAVTSGGDQEPAGDPAPAHGEPGAVQEELAPAPAPAPAPAAVPATPPSPTQPLPLPRT